MKGYCSQIVCPSVTQFSLVLHALCRRFLDHSTLWREILLRFIFLLMMIFSNCCNFVMFVKVKVLSSHFVSISTHAQRVLGGCVSQYHDYAKETSEVHRDIICRLILASFAYRNHAISAKTGYYCEDKIHGHTRVVEWSPASNSCTHTLAGEIHYCLVDSMDLLK